MTKLINVIQGSAEVADENGAVIGSVSQQNNGKYNVWWAYGKDGKRISEYPNCKRSHAVKEVETNANQ